MKNKKLNKTNMPLPNQDVTIFAQLRSHQDVSIECIAYGPHRGLMLPSKSSEKNESFFETISEHVFGLNMNIEGLQANKKICDFI